MSKYITCGKDYKLVCSFLRWNVDMQAIKVLRRKNIVYCSGTFLKPDEWEELCRADQSELPDGSELKIRNVPAEFEWLLS